MNTFRGLFYRAWRPAIAALSLALIAYLLYFHNLTHLVPGYSTHELQSYASAADWHRIAHDPLNAPFKLLVWLAIALGHHSLLVTRLVAACFGVVAVVLFFIISRAWFGFRTAFLATVLFATSAGFMHVARLGTPEVLQLGILLFMAALLWYRRVHKRRAISGYLLVIALALLLYIPGMIWFELIGLVLLKTGARTRYNATALLHKILWPLLFILCLVPLIVASAHSPRLLLSALALPDTVHQLLQIPSNLLRVLLGIGFYSPGGSELWVGHAPLLDAIELILAAMGLYYYVRREQSVRTVFMLGSTVVSLLLVSMGGPAVFASLVPLMYLFVASGLDHLLGQWLGVFPRNPIARGFGIAIVSIMLFFSVLYQTRSYFIAWPHNTTTRHDFSHPQS